MWNRILGKASEAEKNPSTPESRRTSKSGSQRSTPRRSESQKSTTSSRKAHHNEERDQGFNPTSTSYSSTTRIQYPGTAAASVGTSFATASDGPTKDSYLPPGLVRNASLANQIPRSAAADDERATALGSSNRSKKEKEKSSDMDQKRDRKERRGTRERDDDRRESKSSRDRKSTRDSKGKERAMSTDDAAYIDTPRRDRAVTTSDGANGSSSFVPLDGQHETFRPESAPGQQSSHVQDQFPGQFPAYSTTPYRPPLAASEGGPGLAAEYYGDAGQSVAEQPGARIHSPSLIVGAEPHLQAASAVAAPPPEPSATGGVGAAASFFDGTFSAGSDIEGHHAPKPTSTSGPSVSQYTSVAPPVSTYPTSGSNLTNHHSSSAPVLPTLGAAAAGAAAVYYTSNHTSNPARPEHASSSISGHGSVAESSSYQQSAATHDQYTSYPSSTRPPAKPGKHSSHSSNMPLYAAGAAGLAAAVSDHNHSGSPHQHGTAHHSDSIHHHGTAHNHSNGQHYGGGYMAQQHRHRHRGPLSALVDFFKDPEGVAQFEEYTEYIGVCRHCFAPGSSARDAPRKHNYRRRRSNEKLGSSVRVDKESRYSSSENESRRRKNNSWLEAGIAGYGLGKVSESLFKQDRDFDNAHNIHSGRVRKSHRRGSSSSSERKSRLSRGAVHRSTDTLAHRSRSDYQAKTGITSDGKLHHKDSHGIIHTSTVKAGASQRRSRSRSRSRDRAGKFSEAALGAAVGSSLIASASRRRSPSPKKVLIRPRHGDEGKSELASVLRFDDSASHSGHRRPRHSPDSAPRKDRRKDKTNRGFFNFGNASSSSSSSDLAFGTGHAQPSAKSTKPKRKDKGSRDADAALLGLGAAAAALALNQKQRSRHKGELIAVKESQGKNKSRKHERKDRKSSSTSEEDLWESASEGEWSSADSELAYGGSLHKRSLESLSSDSSGLNKWSWRWGSKKHSKKPTADRRRPSEADHANPAAATMATGIDPSRISAEGDWQDHRITSNSTAPLQHVYPIPTSDPTQFDVTRHDARLPFHQPYINARPNPVPIQHPRPVAPVSPAVYTTQSPYPHSYSAPTGPPSLPRYPQPATDGYVAPIQSRDQVPGVFPTGSEYFEPLMQNSKQEPKPRRRDSSPVAQTPGYMPSSFGRRRRKSLKDESSSVRFDLTKEQEDKDRREERRRRKVEDKRSERLQQQELEDRTAAEQDRLERDISSKSRTERRSGEDSVTIKKETWAAPATAGVVAAAIGATVAAKGSSEARFSNIYDEPHEDREEREIEVTIKESHDPLESTAPADVEQRGRPSKKEPMSVWQAAAKIKRSQSHTEYAAYFTPLELLEKSSDVKQVVGPNADSEITVYQVPRVVTVEPAVHHGHSLSRAYSFPIAVKDIEHDTKPLPWSVPSLNLVEPTPPSSRSGSIAGSRSPRSRSPLNKEIAIDIPLEPLESVTDTPVTHSEPTEVKYTVIEPRERSTPIADSPVDEPNSTAAVPGISSLKNRKKRKESSPKADYGDDLDFAATVAAGLQDTGFDPSIVVDDPSFRRRDSPPGSEGEDFRRSPTATVTEITPDNLDPESPPHGFVEEIPEHHIPGSFDEEEERTMLPGPKPKGNDCSVEETDNVRATPLAYSNGPVPTQPEATSNSAIDSMAKESYNEREEAAREGVSAERTEPLDNASAEPHVYTAEPESFEPGNVRDVTIDPTVGDSQSASEREGPTQSQPLVEETAYSSPDKIDYPSDEAPSVAATAPLPSSSTQNKKSKKNSKRRSVGFDDTASIISAPATLGDTQEPSSKREKGRKGGILGIFSRTSEPLTESKGSQETPVEAKLEDFEEPKKRSKKSKSRKATLEEEAAPTAEEPTVSQEPEVQDDWSTSKTSERGKGKRRSSKQDPGRITQDLPAQVIAPASPRHDPMPSPNEMLTDLEVPKVEHSLQTSGLGAGIDDVGDELRTHDEQEPSFLGERPEKPPLPDLPDTCEDPGGQLDVQPLESRNDSPASKAEKQKWRLSDLHADSRSVPYSTPSPTAVPLRPLRFGRRPSSPGLAKSLPSTPQPPITADSPFTPRRRERPHSTEFKSNEFRPIWLLEKHGSRQEPAPQETYPSLPSSHTTSRASSIHEADDPYQTEPLDLAIGEQNDYVVPGHRGLAIDTSRGVSDSELLDSQQATPTAASFHSILQESSAGSQEQVFEPDPPKAESLDVVPALDASADPIAEGARDERLLHGVDDLFPQRRSSSPARYDIGLAEETSRQPEDMAPLPLEGVRKAGSGLTSMLKDAALSAFIGGSAAALLKSTSQHDEHLEQSPEKPALEEISEAGEDLAPKPMDEVPGRLTAEEMRLLQEQDAQDAVDSWFTPTQPKRTQDKKGKKRGQSLEAAAPTPPADSPAELSRPVLEDAPFTAEPTETTITAQPEISGTAPSTEAANPEWQAALMNRKDPKGKKKKNKKRSTDVWDDRSASPDVSTGESLSIISSAAKKGVEPADTAATHELAAGPISAKDTSASPTGAEVSQETEVLPSTTQDEESLALTKKSKKGKKKNRQLPLAEQAQDNITEEAPAGQPAENGITEDRDVLPEKLDVSTLSASEEAVPPKPVEQEHPKLPAGPPMAEHLPNETAGRESDAGLELPILPASILLPVDDDLHLAIPPDSPAIQPANIPLPVDGDLDLVSLPESPINQPMDVAQAPVSSPSVLNRESKAGLGLPTLPASMPLPADDDLDLISPPESPVIEPIDVAQAPLSSPSVLDRESEAGFGLPICVPLPVDDDLDLAVPPDSPVIKSIDVTETSVSPPRTLDRESNLELPNLPASIPLPVDDDLDFTAPPDSPVIHPTDIAQAPVSPPSALDAKSQTLEHSKVPPLDQPPSILGPYEGTTGIAESDAAPLVLAKAISDLNLPENATLDQPVESILGVPEMKTDVPKEQPEDEWPTFTAKNSKRSKKRNKNEPNTTQNVADIQASTAQDTLPQRSDGLVANKDLREAITVQDTPAFEALELVEDKDVVEDPEPVNPLGGTIDEPAGEDVKWPTVSMKEKESKKDKEGRLSEPQETQPEELRPSAVAEIPTATTNTAEHVQALLHPSEPEKDIVSAEQTPAVESLKRDLRGETHILPHGLPEEQASQAKAEDSHEQLNEARETVSEQPLPAPLPTDSAVEDDPVQSSADQQLGQLEQLTTGQRDTALQHSTASTETAAEVQQMLAEEKSSDSLPVPLEDNSRAPAEQTAADDSAWAPTKKKKKGKNSKSPDDAVSADTGRNIQPSAPTESGVPVSEQVPASEPVEDLSVKQSKKDKKSKRKGLSRSKSDVEEEPREESRDAPIVEEPSNVEEMAMTEDAPSILKKTDQLPSMEMPMILDAVPEETPFDAVAQVGSNTSAKEPRISTPVSNMDEISNSTALPISSGEETSQVSKLEQMGMSPSSVTGRHDELSSVELPTSTEAVGDDRLLTGPDQPLVRAAVEEALKSSPPARIEDSEPGPKPQAGSLPMEEAPVTSNLSETPIVDPALIVKVVDSLPMSSQSPPSQENPGVPQSPDDDLLGRSPNDSVNQSSPSTANIQDAALQPPISKKDKKKAQKAKAVTWGDEPLVEASEQFPHPSNEPSDLTGQLESEGVVEETPATSKKDKKKSKKARALVVEEDLPEASREASEPPQEDVELAKGQPADTVIDDDFGVIAGLPKSKKDKKKAKKAKALAWDGDAPEASADVHEAQPETDDRVNDEPIIPVVAESPVVVDEPTRSKKDKKKAKKSRSFAWEEDEPTTPSGDEPQRQAAPSAEAAAVDDPSNSTQSAPVDKGFEDPIEQSTSKSKKKGKKSQVMGLDDEEPSILSTSADADEATPTLGEQAITEQVQHVEAVPEEAAVDVPENQAAPKKSKKKGKKSKFVAFDDEPSISSSRDEVEQDVGDEGPEATATISDTHPAGDQEVVEATVIEATMPKSKKDKKKAKKSKALAWENEPSAMPEDPSVSHSTLGLTDQPTQPAQTPQAETFANVGDVIASNVGIEHELDALVRQKEEPSVEPLHEPTESQGAEALPDVHEIATTDSRGAQAKTPDTASSYPLEPTVVIPPAGNVPTLPSQINNADAEPTPPPSAGDALKIAEEIIPPPSAKTAAAPSPLSEILLEEPREPSPAPATDNALKTAEEVNLPASDGGVAEPSVLLENVPSEHVEPNPTPSIADALRTAEQVTSPPPEDTSLDRTSLAEVVTSETLKASPVPTAVDARGIAETELSSPSKGLTAQEMDLPVDISKEPAEPVLVPEADNIDLVEEFPSINKEERRAMAQEERPVITRQEADLPAGEPILPIEPGLGSEVFCRAIPEDPLVSGELNAAENVKFPPLSNKDETEDEKGEKTLAFDDDKVSYTAAPAASEPPAEVSKDDGTMTSLEPTGAVVEFPPSSREDEFEAERNKEALETVVDKPSTSTIPVNPNTAIDVLGHDAEESRVPELGAAEPTEMVDEFPLLSKKDKKKAKKKSRSSAFDEDRSGSVTPATPDPELDVLNQASEEPSILATPIEAEAAETATEFPSLSKKDKKRAKKKSKLSAFDEEPSGSMTPATPDPELDVSNQALEESTISAKLVEVEAAETVTEFPSLSKKDKKKAKKKSKFSTFDEELSGSVTPATPDPEFIVSNQAPEEQSISAEKIETEPAVEVMDKGAEEVDLPVEPVVIENKDSLSLDKKQKKNAKKSKTLPAFDEDAFKSTMPADLAPELEIVDQAAEESALPVNPTVDGGEHSLSSSKENKEEIEAATEALALDNAPTETATLTEQDRATKSFDRTAQEPKLSVEPSTAQDEEFAPISKKDRKKAKKGKNARACDDDEPSRSTTPATPIAGLDVMDPTDEPPLPAEPTTPAETFFSQSKKDKKKAKKAKKMLAGEEEDPEMTPAVEEAKALENPLQEQARNLPAAPDLRDSGRIDLPAAQDIEAEGGTAIRPVDTVITDRDVVAEAEPEIPTSSKKSKKDEKNAKKAHASAWDYEVVAEPSLHDAVTDPITPLAPIQESGAPEDTATREATIATDPADPAVPQSKNEEAEHFPVPGPSSLSYLEKDLAPRHEAPAPAEPAEHVVPLVTDEGYDQPESSQRPLTPPPETSSQLRADVGISPTGQETFNQPATLASTQKAETLLTPTVQETLVDQADGFSSVTTAKKSKKGKKAKKVPISWEDDTKTPPPPVDEASKDAEDFPAPSRPEMAAWPTEVRLNQTEGSVQEQQPLEGLADANSLTDQPAGPPADADEHQDYFAQPQMHDTPEPPHSLPRDVHSGTVLSPTPTSSAEGTEPKPQGFLTREEVPATTLTQPEVAKEQINQPEPMVEQSRSQDVAAEPTGDSEAFVPAKKDKKSKRKQKKPVVDDVMWEFPSMAPPVPPVVAPTETEQIRSGQAPETNDSVLTLDPYGVAQAAPTSEQLGVVELEKVAHEEPSRDFGFRESSEPPVRDNEAKIPAETTIPNEPVVEAAAVDEWGSVPKKGKNRKKSRKNKEVEEEDRTEPTGLPEEPEAPVQLEKTQLEGRQSELNAPQEDFKHSAYQPTEDETSGDAGTGAGKAIATAAAVGAGFVAAEKLGRKESKKGKKSEKSRQPSSTWAEPEEPSQQTAAPVIQEQYPESQSRAPTPERRHSSPIQAWHQYISPSQSPKRSELYDVEYDRPRSAGSVRRKRSHEKQISPSPTAERRSPIEAWHQYNTPGQSPQQSETYDYNARQAADEVDDASAKQMNRDSAVHVMDSPIVSQRSPVRRAMRDSGYPDTEASPIIGVESEHQDHAHEAIRQEGKYEDINVPTYPLQPTKAFEDPREPSPVSSTTKDRSSVLFQSSPSTREEHAQQVPLEEHPRYEEVLEAHTDDGMERQATSPPLDLPREDNSARVNAQAESLAALSGLRGASQDQARPSIFGGPIGSSSDGMPPETGLDHDSINRRRLNTITEYSPEASPLHNRNRDLSDVGSPDAGVKTARRSGTPQAIPSKRRVRSPSIEQGKGIISPDDPGPHLSWPAADEERQHVDIERSRSRGTERRPSSHQSNISSLVSGQPKQREYERRSLSGASNHSVESITAIIRTPPDQIRSASGMSNRSSGTPPLRRTDRSISGDLRGANRKSQAKKRAKQPEAESEIAVPPSPSTPHDTSHERRKSRVKEMADVYVSRGLMTPFGLMTDFR
ncbi:MAG: hypothetical protein L6R39_002865 [Caloplaca ligustica]|nr:MAG: hypothetical protein L6R39_002865 [Caloplaca ligustica]